MAYLRSLSISNIVLIAPPPTNPVMWAACAPEKYGVPPTTLPDRSNEHTGLYAARCVMLGKELSIPCLDLWTLIQKDPDWRSLLVDGLHFNAAGNLKVCSTCACVCSMAGF